MYDHILVAVALDHYHDQGNHKALDVARTLMSEGGRITALHVLEEMPNYAMQQLPQDFAKKHIVEERDAFENLLRDEQGVTPVLINGHAGVSIVDYAEKNDVDCIVIASHRPGLMDFFIGSTASRVVSHANCPVHVLR